jgi:hypothetical protein
MVLNAHCGTSVPTDINPKKIAAKSGQSVASLLSCLAEDSTVTQNSSDKEERLSAHDWRKIISRRARLSVHNWGKLITRRASQSNHPHGKQAREGHGWVDVYIRLQGSGGDDEMKNSLLIELPPRPFFYNNVKETDIDAEDRPVPGLLRHIQERGDHNFQMIDEPLDLWYLDFLVHDEDNDEDIQDY